MNNLAIKCSKFLEMVAKIFLIIISILIGLSPLTLLLVGLGADFKIFQWIILSLGIIIGLLITIPIAIMMICEFSQLDMEGE